MKSIIYKCIVVGLLVFSFEQIIIQNPDHQENSRYNQVLLHPQESSSVFDRNLDTLIEGDGSPAEIIATFNEANTVNRIDIISSDPPESIKFSAYQNDKWETILNQKLTSNYTQVLSINTQINHSSLLKINFSSQDPNQHYRIQDINFIHNNVVPRYKFYLNYFFQLPRSPWAYVYYSLIVWLTITYTFLPIIKKHASQYPPLILLTLSSICWYIFASLITSINLIVQISELNRLLIIVSLIIALTNFLMLPIPTTITNLNIYAASIMVLISLHLLVDYSQQGILRQDANSDYSINFHYPYKIYEQDYINPYATSKVFLHHLTKNDPSTKMMMGINWITDRTPLSSMIVIPFFELFGERFFTYQIVTLTISSLIVFPIIASISIIAGNLIAQITTIFFLASHFWLFHYKQVPSKSIAFIFIHTYLYLILTAKKPRDFVIAGTVFSIAYLTHPMSLTYGLCVIYPFIKKYSYQQIKKHVLITIKTPQSIGQYRLTKAIIAFVIPCIISYIGWDIIANNIGKSNALASYFFAYDYQTIVDAQTQDVRLEIPLNSNTFQELLKNKYYNTLSLVLPQPHPTILKTWNSYRTTLWGTCTLVLTPFILLGIIKYGKKFKKILLCTIALPIFSYIFFLLGFFNDLGLMLILAGIIPYLLMFATKFLLSVSKNTATSLVLITAVITAQLIEHIYISWKINAYTPLNEIPVYLKAGFPQLTTAVNLFYYWYITIMIIGFSLIIREMKNHKA